MAIKRKIFQISGNDGADTIDTQASRPGGPAADLRSRGAPAQPQPAGQTVLLSDQMGRPSQVAATAASALSQSATLVSTAGSGLIINLMWDTSVTTLAPGLMSAFETDVINAATFLEGLISTNATVNLQVGYNEVGGSALSSGALGESSTYLTSISYASLRTALASTASTDATDKSMVASLPSASPTSGTDWVTTAQAKALGLSAANGTAVDGSVGFGVSSEFSYGDTNTSGTVAAGTYDFFGTVVHEITEVMGRQMLVGSTFSGGPGYTLMDLAHYSAPGVRDLTQSTPGYFSANGGVSSLGALNTVSGGDAGDWASSVTDDPLDAFATPGVLESFSTNDTAVMDALGWNLAGSTVPSQIGVALAPATAGLAAAQGTSGLAAGAALASVKAVGGQAGDSFSYTLGGAGAGSFSLNAATGVLSAGASDVTGTLGGHAYALTVTATDTTTGATSPASALEVVVGNIRANSVSVASLVGSAATAAPTFIYGLGGADTLNGQGMTGTLYFDGGTGADKMTGGSGVNDFLYGSTADSTATAPDLIQAFNVATDTIDLTGIGASGLAFAGALAGSATSITADSIAYQQTGSGASALTSLYVNTSAGTEALTAANMKIELQGALALTSANVLHT